MIIKVSNGIAEHIGKERLRREYNINDWDFRQGRYGTIDLGVMTSPQIKKVKEMFEAHKNVRGVPGILSDIDVLLDGMKDPDTKTARSAQQFYVYATNVLLNTERQYVYKRDGDSWFAYYVNGLKYIPKQVDDEGRVTPPHITMELYAKEFDGENYHTEVWWEADVKGKTVVENFRDKGILLETPALKENYEKEKSRFLELAERIGKQMWASGLASDEVDGNYRGNRSWYHQQASIVAMEKDGEKSRVVIDVFFEGDRDRGSRKSSASGSFWMKKKTKLSDEEKEEGLREEDKVDEVPQHSFEVPIHPFLVVFDLKRHMRLRIHSSQLEEYIYDKNIDSKLILSTEVKDLVQILLRYRKTHFDDVIKGKAGGIVVLLTGSPGTGKTLTAEVYAESEGRPLYSVQASQLGTNEEALEAELMRTLARAKRWNAVMLLDEADVYIKQRGGDLQQNAIVGVFLRVLEYHASVLFLTTNRGDDVDDAIASRCIARIQYQVPGMVDQVRIWKVLADQAGVKIDEEALIDIAMTYKELSGRDVKNLLRLALITVEANKGQITKKVIDHVMRFKATT